MSHYDHEECRCESMEEFDLQYTPVGFKRTCCICAEDDCELYEKYKKDKEGINNDGGLNKKFPESICNMVDEFNDEGEK